MYVGVGGGALSKA